MVTNEEIYEALKTIKQVCDDNTLSCRGCPLRAKKDEISLTCAVRDNAPCGWLLVEPPDSHWLAMKQGR